MLVAIIVGVPAMVGLHRFQLERQKEAYIARWASVFGEKHDLSDLRALGQHETPYIVEFENGEWVAAKSECACAGAGFDATVFVDGRGAVHYQENHHFCGGEGLASELTRIGAKDLEGFYNGLKDLGVELQP
jgi:hypothetical protein